MAQLEPHKAEIEASGLLVYIAAEKLGGMFKPEKYLIEHPISFPFLLDEDRVVTKAYGIYQRLRIDAFNIARPSTFVVDRQQVVRYLYAGASQTDRSPITEVLNALRTANSSG